jgi:hypothetical protein
VFYQASFARPTRQSAKEDADVSVLFDVNPLGSILLGICCNLLQVEQVQLEQAQPVEKSLASGQFNQQSTKKTNHSETTVPKFCTGVRSKFELGAVLTVLATKLTIVGSFVLGVSHGRSSFDYS